MLHIEGDLRRFTVVTALHPVCGRARPVGDHIHHGTGMPVDQTRPDIGGVPDARQFTSADQPVDDGRATSVVLDLDGRIVDQYRYGFISISPNAAWTANGELVHTDEEDCKISLIDPVTQRRRTLGHCNGGPYATLDDRIIQHPTQPTTRSASLTSVDLNGNDERPFLSIPKPATITRLDITGHNPAQRP